MFSELCNPNRPGVRVLRAVGPFIILVNLARWRRGTVTRYCIVHLKDKWVEGWADDERAAIRVAREAQAAIVGARFP